MHAMMMMASASPLFSQQHCSNIAAAAAAAAVSAGNISQGACVGGSEELKTWLEKYFSDHQR